MPAAPAASATASARAACIEWGGSAPVNWRAQGTLDHHSERARRSKSMTAGYWYSFRRFAAAMERRPDSGIWGQRILSVLDPGGGFMRFRWVFRSRRRDQVPCSNAARARGRRSARAARVGFLISDPTGEESGNCGTKTISGIECGAMPQFKVRNNRASTPKFFFARTERRVARTGCRRRLPQFQRASNADQRGRWPIPMMVAPASLSFSSR